MFICSVDTRAWHDSREQGLFVACSSGEIQIRVSSRYASLEEQSSATSYSRQSSSSSRSGDCVNLSSSSSSRLCRSSSTSACSSRGSSSCTSDSTASRRGRGSREGRHVLAQEGRGCDLGRGQTGCRAAIGASVGFAQQEREGREQSQSFGYL